MNTIISRKAARELIDLLESDDDGIQDEFDRLANALDNAQEGTSQGEPQTITITINPGDF